MKAMLEEINIISAFFSLEREETIPQIAKNAIQKYTNKFTGIIIIYNIKDNIYANLL